MEYLSRIGRSLLISPTTIFYRLDALHNFMSTSTTKTFEMSKRHLSVSVPLERPCSSAQPVATYVHIADDDDNETLSHTPLNGREAAAAAAGRSTVMNN